MSLKNWVNRHPQLTAWVVLAVGMVAILIWSAKDVGLETLQWAALIVATILLAGLCVWIIGWNGEEEDQKTESPEPQLDHRPEGPTAAFRRRRTIRSSRLAYAHSPSCSQCIAVSSANGGGYGCTARAIWITFSTLQQPTA
jgi:ABC-type nickel/cobalt efflux system permease component RcnA